MYLNSRSFRKIFSNKRLLLCVVTVICFTCCWLKPEEKKKIVVIEKPNPKVEFHKAETCIKKILNEVNEQNFDLYWLTLSERINLCTNNLTKILPIKEFYNEDEIKYGFLPNSTKDDCNVVTLGIGRDVRSERELSQQFNGCKYFGVDPDPDESGRIFKAVLNGTYIKGLVGAKSGTYKASVLGENSDINYKTKNLLHYALEELLSENYAHDFIDFLFIDIEGDEFELIQDLIYHSKKYPLICQINVEYHNPFQENRGTSFFVDLIESMTRNQYFPIKIETKMNFLFNRIFYFNMDKFCVNKFLKNYLL